MGLKTCLLSIALLFSIGAYAQDKIYKKKGEVIESKVKAIEGNTITYKRSDNPNGPDYTISKNEVTKIVYQNGTSDSFEGSNKKEKTGRHGKVISTTEKKANKYGDNILSIIPGAYTADLDGTINDPGIGLCYERLLDKHGHISFTLPVLISFLSDRDFNNNIYNGNIIAGVSTKGYTSISVMPGLKFYPVRSDQAIRYSLGASFFTMFGKEPFYVYSNNANTAGDYHYVMYGLMISNSINVSATKHFCMSMDVNGAIPISDNRRTDRSSFDILFAPIMQFILKVGYRY